MLVVTNEFGAVTSAVAVVTVNIPPPNLQPLGMDATGFRFSFRSVTGVLYVSEHRDGLESGGWTELEWRTGSGGLEIVTDASAGGAMRFYRVRVE